MDQEQRIAHLEARVEWLESVVERVAKVTGVNATPMTMATAPPPDAISHQALPTVELPGVDAEVVFLVRKGKLSDATRRVRRSTHLSLSEAKDVVDQLARQLQG
jgi:ribosomal protein L7/L12